MADQGRRQHKDEPHGKTDHHTARPLPRNSCQRSGTLERRFLEGARPTTAGNRIDDLGLEGGTAEPRELLGLLSEPAGRDPEYWGEHIPQRSLCEHTRAHPGHGPSARRPAPGHSPTRRTHPPLTADGIATGYRSPHPEQVGPSQQAR